MSKWTHIVCDECWRAQRPDREPHRLVVLGGLPHGIDPGESPEVCCQCGKPANGIWVRADPATMACKGEGPNHDEPEE